jgi:hypothetical protein
MEIYDTATLLEVLRVQPVLSPYWLGLFPDEVVFEQEEILFDKIRTDKKLAPFVAPNVQGKVIKSRGYSTKAFRPAYVKPKDVVDYTRALKRRAGEQPLGELSIAERFDAALADTLLEMNNRIDNRLEWMAAMAAIYGYVDVEGDDYPLVRVDFGRDSSLTATLSGTARWDQSGADPLQNIEDIRTTSYQLARSPINRLTFGLHAWQSFVKNADVKALLSNQVRGGSTEYNAKLGDGSPQQFRGILSGPNTAPVELWTYADSYTADDGTEVQLFPTNAVHGSGPGVGGVRCFGAIKDRRAGFVALSRFPKMWDEDDPSVTYAMVQSAPLMVPREPNATFLMIVQDA